ncbi:SDR family NAD(P)-dependent oxidoreductase [Comamonas sediminis]|uniref:SDR family NAD(P)-dependent oxidoreductase n=1 Tax=Comamonas sediminis TaxID=1783360 RepID=A0ABV4B3Y9_9BURK
MPLNTPIERWYGLRVWLIGASSGIGLALAEQLHAAGARIIVSARRQEVLDAFAEQHPGCLPLPLDVSDRDAVVSAVHQLLEDGPLDMVCYCAGQRQTMRADDLDLNRMLQHREVNLTGALHVITAVTPHLLAAARDGRQPHLSLVASVAGLRGLQGNLAYGPSQAALINLAQTLQLELPAQGVGVSLAVVKPALTATSLTEPHPASLPVWQHPAQAAEAMLKGWAHGHFLLGAPWRSRLSWRPGFTSPASSLFAWVRRLQGN